MEIDIATERTGSACVLTVAGEVDVYTAPRLKEQLVAALDDGCLNVVVVLDDVAFIDSSGLGVLVSALRRVKENDGTLRLVCTRDSILKIFRITGLDKVFPLFSDMAEAREF
jgi:anti-sigma B factor antagonist